MRIGIDARFYGPVGKGLGRYTQEVVDNIIKMSGADNGTIFDYVIFLSPENYDEFIADAANVKKVKLDIAWYGFAEQILFPFYIWKEHLDLMHFPHFNVPVLTPVKFIVTIHDLILTHFPTVRATTLSPFKYKFKNFAYRLVILNAIFRARRIIAVSNFTKDDLVKQFKVRPDKISVTYEGVANLAKGRDSLFVARLDSQETLEFYHIPQKFLLYVGNAYPHKNLDFLLNIFSKLHKARPELCLVMVGKNDYFYSKIKDEARRLNLWQPNNSNNPVIFPGYVPDAQLEVLYREAALYIFPSLYEGFGLPPLEAMARSCPVLSSNRSSLPEILEEAALYFNPEDDNDALTKIDLLLNNEDMRQNLIAKGIDQAKKYNWWECANKTL
ncbi:MAG: glycosyltransferase family 4 protein, partial [Patescibacteria group bacterium]